MESVVFSYEMRDYCGFENVPDVSKLTRFKQDFCEYIREVFERLADMREPICAEMDKALADMLVFDPTFDANVGYAAFVSECAASNPAVKKYINVNCAPSSSQ